MRSSAPSRRKTPHFRIRATSSRQAASFSRTCAAARAFSFDPDLGETGEEEYESDDFFDETSEDEELLPEAPEPEDDDFFDDESDDGETLSFLAPVGPDDPVAKAFREYWETTEAQPEYRRQLEVIEKACDKEFFDWFSLNMDDIRRSCFLAGNTSGYFTMPRPALLVRVLREAAKDEFPDEDWSPEVARDARFLRACESASGKRRKADAPSRKSNASPPRTNACRRAPKPPTQRTVEPAR